MDNPYQQEQLKSYHTPDYDFMTSDKPSTTCYMLAQSTFNDPGVLLRGG